MRSTGWSKPAAWRFAIAVPAALLLALAGPAYAARLNALYLSSPLAVARAPSISAPWQGLSDLAAGWRPAVHGADREFLDGFEEPGSGVVIRYVALYQLRASGDALTKTGNRLADDKQWHITGYGRAEAILGGKPTMVASTEIVSGQHHRLVWSFYVVDGRIATGFLEAKLLRARAVLLDREPVGAFVAISASMDDPKDPAEQQLTHFLAASQPLTEYLLTLPKN
jgi:EpsI family protein